jgi:hypothetical protein
MKTLILELRDKGTFIPILALQLSHTSLSEASLLAQGGWGDANVVPYIMLMPLNESKVTASFGVYLWNDRTFSTAHHYISNNFDTLVSGDVIDVEFILGETHTKKEPQ